MVFWLIWLLLLVVCPLLGAVFAGRPAGNYLEFPPQTMQVDHQEFSWNFFWIITLFLLITTWPFVRRMLFNSYSYRPRRKEGCRFPWWGWIGLAGTVTFWILAWSRFPWFAALQRYTFFPLWFSMIVLLNAVAWRYTCQSLLTHRPRFFLLLFPLSALFWWIFEYLNRFVGNWYYTGVGELGAGSYFSEATLAFSTVLPAVFSMRYLLLRIPVFSHAFSDFRALPRLLSRPLWIAAGLLSLGGLVAVGYLPEKAYPFVWISPLLLWLSLQVVRGKVDALLRQAARGDMTLLWSSAVAALTCGFFWEMWNYHSEAKWIYSIPGLAILPLFEMPLPGYFGYLPFGMMCALAGHSLFRGLYRRPYTWLGQEEDRSMQTAGDSELRNPEGQKP